MLRERLQGALGGVAQSTRKISTHSTGSTHNRPPAHAPGNLMNPYQQQPLQPQNTGYTGFQPQPPADPYDPYGRRISSEAAPFPYQPSPPATFMQPSPIGQGSNPQQPNIFTPDFSQPYSQVPPPNPNAGSAMAPPPPPTSGMS